MTIADRVNMKTILVTATLAAMSTAVLAQEPQPFATAPKNQPIMAWVQEGETPTGAPTGFWSFIIWRGDGDRWYELGGTSWAGALPLYWLPLAEAPTGSSWEERFMMDAAGK